MGEAKRQPDGNRNRIRIDDRLLTALAALMIVTLAATLFIAPRYAKVAKAYAEKHSEYRTASAELKAAQEDRDEKAARLEELKTMSAENEVLESEVFALISQLEKDIQAGRSNRKICYITIDDGPYNRGKQFLKLFKERDIKATFFLTTANGNKLPDQGDLTAESMYPQYLKFGNTIGNHTYTHNYSEGGVYKDAKSFMKAVNKQEDFTEKATGGYRPKIVRFPGGTSMAGDQLDAITKALREEGYGWIDWTVDSGDSWGTDEGTTDLIRKNVISAAGKSDQKIMVVLFHEWSQKSLDAMPDILDSLEEQGYIFLPLFYDSTMVEK